LLHVNKKTSIFNTFFFLHTSLFFQPILFKIDELAKSSNSRHANLPIMRRTYRMLNGCEMQHNAEVGLFTKPSTFT